MNQLISFVFPILIGVIAMPLIFFRLEDHEHPDESRYPPHRSLRVVRDRKQERGVPK